MYSENLKDLIGKNIAAHRKRSGLTQVELADKLNYSDKAVSKWEQDQGYPEVEKLLLLSKKLNISLDALMSVEINRGAGVKNENIDVSGICTCCYSENSVYPFFSHRASGGFSGTFVSAIAL